MAILTNSKALHKIKTGTEAAIDLYVVTNYDFGSNYTIVKKESATGDGGISFHNGRLIESIPITGILLAESLEELNKKVIELRKLSDRKVVVDFIYPYKSDIRTNKFYIESIRFTPEKGKNTEINFNMVLIEKRDANVSETQENLVSFAQKDALVTLAKERLEGV